GAPRPPLDDAGDGHRSRAVGTGLRLRRRCLQYRLDRLDHRGDRRRRDAGDLWRGQRAQGAVAAVHPQPAGLGPAVRAVQDAGPAAVLRPALAGRHALGRDAGAGFSGDTGRHASLRARAGRLPAHQLRHRALRRAPCALGRRDDGRDHPHQHVGEHLHVRRRRLAGHPQPSRRRRARLERHRFQRSAGRGAGAGARRPAAAAHRRAPPRLPLKESAMSHHDPQRLHALDAVRGFALLLGVAFHAALSFMPGWPPGLWVMSDNSPSALLRDAAFVSHVFRMTLFFFIAGYFARLLHGRLGTAGFWNNRALRIGLPLVAGWVVLFPLISVVWVAGLTKVFGGTMPEMPTMPKVAGAFPLTHLWFLYQLLQCYVLVMLVAGLVARLDRGQALRGLADRLFASALRLPVIVLFVLALPVASALLPLSNWFYWTGIPTPDQTLLPQLAPLVGFGTAFAVGWLLHRSADGLAALARYWLPNLLAGAAAAAWMLASMRATPMAPDGVPANPLMLFEGAVLTKAGFAVMHGVAAWGLSLGLTGTALRYLGDYSPVRRYVADASYWIYLAHLPVVAALQVWVGHWPLHWSLKYPFILATSLALLFASYHWLVRPTLIGQLLNGRRARRGTGNAPLPEPPAPAPRPTCRTSHDAAPVASLQGISRSFGGVTALDRLDLQLRRGELLALLGPNGAGKTTAISLWLGLLEPDAGTVDLLGGP